MPSPCLLQGTQLILLLPQDEQGHLGHAAVTLQAPPAGLTTKAILAAVHSFYSQPMSAEDQAGAMAVHPQIRRLLQVREYLQGLSTCVLRVCCVKANGSVL
jgi:hypothetical protein